MLFAEAPMFRLFDAGSRLCDGLTRRQWLAIGGLSALSAISSNVAASPTRDRSFGKAKSIFVVFLTGGPSQHDTWDPKPDAPDEIRGETRPIATSLPGLTVGELMPKTAAVAHHTCVLRAMSTGDNAHSSSGYFMHTGKPHQPLSFENSRVGPPNNAPSLAAVVKALRPAPGNLPTAITLPERIANMGAITWPGQDGGTLGRTADPWLLTCDPAAPTFRVPELTLPEELPPLRVDGRRSLLNQVDRHLAGIEGQGRFNQQRDQAFDLLQTPAVRRAFDLHQEPAQLRDRYGRSKFGQSVLLARRLVEAGVPFIQVNWPAVKDNPDADQGWDTHQRHFAATKRFLMPTMDAAYATLIADLRDRGLLEQTLVVWTGEFGRTPRINPNAGRDHWGPVFSGALAGGGIRGGQIVGASDRVGSFPRDGRIVPQDLHATMLHCLGIAADETVRDLEGRVFNATSGSVVSQLF